MKSIASFAISFAALAMSLSVARASDPIAVYALVEKTVLEPPDNPERVQVWGVFALAKPDNRNDYQDPQRGYLYFKLPETNKSLARTEWADLKGVVGRHEVVAFGDRYRMKARVRKADEKPESPDVFELSQGVVRVRSDTEYAPVKSVLEYAGR